MRLRIVPKPKSGRDGSAMIAALLVVFAVATLSLIHIQLDLSKARETRASVDSKRAFYMAEAGLAEAFYGIVAGDSGNVGTAEEPARFADGVFFTTAQEEGLGRVSLSSTGMCGAGRATLGIVIERSSDSVASLGFFGSENVVIEDGVTVDSFDSRKGITSRTKSGAQVGSNQSLTVGGAVKNTTIKGDARPGPSGVLLLGSKASVTGTTAPFLTSNQLPSVQVPSYTAEGSITTSLLKALATVPAGEHSYDDLRVVGLTKMIIRGPARVVVKNLVVDSLGELAIDTTYGPVELYVTDWLNLKSGSKFGTGTGDPRSTSVFVTASVIKDQDGNGSLDQPVILGATGTFRGAIYAPRAAVSIPSTLEIYGSATAQRLTLKNGGKFHFDEALLEAGVDEGGLPKLIGWRIIQLPDVPEVKLREDALTALTEKLGKVTKSAKSHLKLGKSTREVDD